MRFGLRWPIGHKDLTRKSNHFRCQPKNFPLATCPRLSQVAAMSNPATKAPNFTPETARYYARKAQESRKLNREREIALLAMLKDQARVSEKPEPDEARKQRVLKQIDGYLDDMSGASLKTRLMLGKAIADLWKLVQPTAGVSKPGRNRRDQPSSQPIESPSPEPIKPA